MLASTGSGSPVGQTGPLKSLLALLLLPHLEGPARDHPRGVLVLLQITYQGTHAEVVPAILVCSWLAVVVGMQQFWDVVGSVDAAGCAD